MTTNLRRYLDDETDAMRAAAVPRIRAPRVGEPVRDEGPFVPLPWQRDPQLVGKGLSRRELELLEVIRDGHTNKEAAFLMGCGEQTIKNYMSSILTKLSANDRTHAVVKAVQEGIISLEAGAAGPVTPTVVRSWLDDIDERLTAIDGYVARLRGWLAEARFEIQTVEIKTVKVRKVRKPRMSRAVIERIPGICAIAGCAAPLAAKRPGRGRPPTRCETHVQRREVPGTVAA